MASFKVGQRVRIVSAQGWDSGVPTTPSPVGLEGIVVEVGAGAWEYGVEIHALRHNPTDFAPNVWGFDTHNLAPLTDPAADQFIERMKKLGSEPVVLTPKQLAHG